MEMGIRVCVFQWNVSCEMKKKLIGITVKSCISYIECGCELVIIMLYTKAKFANRPTRIKKWLKNGKWVLFQMAPLSLVRVRWGVR